MFFDNNLIVVVVVAFVISIIALNREHVFFSDTDGNTENLSINTDTGISILNNKVLKRFIIQDHDLARDGWRERV